MVEKKPLLSICIPTYNRAEYLEKSLESIIRQPEFHSDDVEVVISDNCSTDNTQELCQEYVEKYSNIHYFRNEVNIRDENFPTVISRANGNYRKLCNDTLIFKAGSLNFLLKVVKENQIEKPILFFYNLKNGLKKTSNDINIFLRKISFWITSITCFGVWENDFIFTTESCNRNLWQVTFLVNNFIKNRKGIIYKQKLFEMQEVSNKDVSYGIFDVFYNNYLGIIKSFNEVSKKTIEYLEKDLLYHFFTFWLYKYDTTIKNYKVNNDEDFKKRLISTYNNKTYFNHYKIYFKYYKNKHKIIEFVKSILSR